MEKLESDLENFVRLCHLHEKVHNLEQALAEKDRESVKWSELIGSFTQSQHRYLADMERLKYALAEKDREIDCLSEQVNALNRMFRRKHHAYQQLMEKAVRFSECLNDDCKCTISEVNADPACAYVRAREFLESPEVQAWKEQRK